MLALFLAAQAAATPLTAGDVNASLRALADQHEEAHLLHLGTSLEGRSLLGLRVGEQNPIWRMIAGQHGDEPISSALVLETARSLLEGEEGFWELPLPGSILFIPLLNPDGLNDQSRYNRRGVDLNRNYDWKWNPAEYKAGRSPFSEPESQAHQNIALQGVSHTELNVHSGATNMATVWNWSTQSPPHEELLLELANRYASLCSQSGFWITQGADWYQSFGESTDWAYGSLGTLSFTLEISQEKNPNEGAIQSIFDAHLPAIADWLYVEPNLILDLTDQETGRPIPGRLRIPEAEASIANDKLSGRFFHRLSPGDWTLSLEAPGYETETLDLEIPESGALEVSEALQPIELLSDQIESQFFSWSSDAQLWELPSFLAEKQWLAISKPGFSEHRFSIENGEVEIQTNLLGPGAWDIHTHEGSAPRSLFIGNRKKTPALIDLHLDGPRLYLETEGVSANVQAFAFWGSDRAWEPVMLANWAEDEVTLDISTIPAGERVDLLLLDEGHTLSLLDLFGEGLVDLYPPEDTGFFPEFEEPPADPIDGDTDLAASSCGCSSTEEGKPIWFLLGLPIFLARRRRTRQRQAGGYPEHASNFSTQSTNPPPLSLS